MADGRPRELFLVDGNSLAYRAFFALPESIGDSDGRPTNAIYGLASMLVKIIDEHHPGGVVVAWDAGMSGREVTYDLYKAQRKSRPDLLREQWPHLMPLVEAFGYTNVKVEGFEADDVIATLAVRAREQGIPVMVVTGDRDAYQLVGDGVRVMSTSRGITETKVYDRDAVVERYGVAAGAGHRPDGAARRHLRQHPGRPRHRRENRDPAAAAVRHAGGRAGQRRRGLRRQTQAEPGRARRRRPHVEGAGDAAATTSRPGSTWRRRWPPSPTAARCATSCASSSCAPCMERLEEALPEGDAVPGRRVETELEIEAVEGGPEDIGEGPVALAIAGGDAGRPRTASGSSPASRPTTSWRVALGRPAARRPTTPKSLGGGRHGLLAAAAREGVELTLEHDTMVAAYLLEPQRRTYELVELAADAGIGLAEGASGRAAPSEDDGQLALGEEVEAGLEPAEEARLVAALADAQRPRIEELGLEPLLREVELPLVEVLAAMEREGLKLDAERLAEVGAGFGERIETLEKEIHELAERGVHDRLAAAGRPRPLRGARADPQAARQDRLLDRRPRPRPDPRRAPDRREDRVLARADQAEEHLPRLAARPDRPRDRPRPHHLQPDDGRHRPPLQHQSQPAEHPDPHRDRPPGARLLRRRGGRPPALRRLQPGRAARPRPRRRGGGAEGDLPRRRRRPRGDRRRGLRHLPRRGRRRPALEGEDGQLRHRLRPHRLRPRRPAQHPPQGGRGIRRPLPGALPRRAGLPRAGRRAGARRRAT